MEKTQYDRQCEENMRVAKWLGIDYQLAKHYFASELEACKQCHLFDENEDGQYLCAIEGHCVGIWKEKTDTASQDVTSCKECIQFDPVYGKKFYRCAVDGYCPGLWLHKISPMHQLVYEARMRWEKESGWPNV